MPRASPRRNSSKTTPKRQEHKGFLDTIVDSWWGKILVGVVTGFSTYSLYCKLSALESGQVQSTTVWAPIAWLYKIGGMWPPVVIGFLFSLLLVVWGIKQVVSNRE